MSKGNNLILITIDCLRPDHMSCFGYHKNTTPKIDLLARKGVLFRQAISNGPNTYCSFPSIMTSSYAMMNSLGKEMGYPSRWIFLSEHNATIAEVLKREGYHTAAFHSNPWLSSFFHYDRGFDLFDDSLKAFRSSYFLKELGLGANLLYYVTRVIGLYERLLNKQETSAHWLNQKALSWLQKHVRARERFFVWLHYMDVHTPLIPPKLTFLKRIAAIKLEYKMRKRRGVSRDEFKALVDLYDKEIEFVDREIDLFIDRLKGMSISSENTYFVITADHGEQLMERGFVTHGMLYDEVIRVPLIIIGPEIESNTVIEDQVGLLDLAPTIMGLLDISKVNSFCGTRLTPMIEGKSVKKAVISENLSPSVSFRTEEWKCIVSFGKEKKIRLYNLQRNPRETQNLAGQEKEIAREFTHQIENHIRREEAFRRKSRKKKPSQTERLKDDQEQIKARLKALGYS